MTEIKIETITPAKAEKYLGKNTKNRSVKQAKVKQFAADMAGNRWQETGDSIKISPDGLLLDGQHRLLAIIESGQALKMVVVHGVQESAQLVIDTGTKRTFADYLKIQGYSNAHNLAAAIGFGYKYDYFLSRGQSSYAQGISHQDLLKWFERNPGVEASIHMGGEYAKYTGVPHSIGTALHYLFAREVGAEEAVSFWQQASYGFDERSNEEQRETLKAFKKWIRNATSVSHKTTSQEMYAAICIKAFNAWYLNEAVQIFRWVPGGAAPEKFPKIVEP